MPHKGDALGVCRCYAVLQPNSKLTPAMQCAQTPFFGLHVSLDVTIKAEVIREITLNVTIILTTKAAVAHVQRA